jgi:hypothetical protein
MTASIPHIVAENWGGAADTPGQSNVSQIVNIEDSSTTTGGLLISFGFSA